MIIDVNGYFVDDTNALGYVSLPAPCRVVDTRIANGAFGAPQLSAQATRTFPVLSSPCLSGAQSTQAYVFTVTLVPPGLVGFVTVWPTGQSMPVVSTMNDLEGWVLANGGIFKSGTNGSIDVYTTNDTHIVIDVTGYFAPNIGSTLTTTNPCTLVDKLPFDTIIGGTPGFRTADVPGDCAGPGVNVSAFAANFSLKPISGVGYMTVWPAGQTMPLASLLNAGQGEVVNNGAISPAGTINSNQANAFNAAIDTGNGFLYT